MRFHARPRVLSAVTTLLLSLALAPLAWATPTNSASFNPSQPWNAVVTYQSIGLYWKPTNHTQPKARVRFREQGRTTWEDTDEGHELWFDSRNGEYRGSLVELKAGTVYEIQLKQGAGAWTDTTTTCDTTSATECRIPATSTCTKNSTRCTRTWDEQYRIKPGGLRAVHSSNQPLVITEGGSEEEGYVVYEGVDGDNTITLTEASNNHCVIVDAKFVVVRNLILRGCALDGIRLHSVHAVTVNPPSGPRRAASDVIIEDNDIAGWGKQPVFPIPERFWAAIGCTNFHETEDAANQVPPADPHVNRVHRIVIQRNKMHDPRWPGSPWKHVASEGQEHPNGPQGVTFDRCGSNHVVRYNDVYSDNGNHYNDGFGGGENFNEDSGSGGFPWADSDIYGNRISQVYDDAIEAEGDNRNVRIWANYVDHTNQAIGNAATATGPLYVWRNVSNWQANMYCTQCDTDTEQRHGFIKGGGHPNTTYKGGIAYYYHNTVLQPPAPPGKTVPMGGTDGISTVVAVEHLYNFVSRNNVWHLPKASSGNGSIFGDCNVEPCTPPTPDNGPAVDYDLYNGRLSNPGPNPEPNAFGRPGDKIAGNADAIPTYVGGNHYPQSANLPGEPNWSGDFSLAQGTLGSNDSGVAIPNFNTPTTRDVGAQPGPGRMQFGIRPFAQLATTPNPASGQALFQVTFSAARSAANVSSPIAGLTLDFGDGSTQISWTDKAVTQTHGYGAGNYTATLTVTDTKGRASQATLPVTVTGASACTTPLPTGSFTAVPTSGHPPLAVNFDASASTAVSPATITSYSITYGDGASGTGPTQSHTYQNASQFMAVLTVTDSMGCQSAPVTQTINVSNCTPPTARLTAAPTSGNPPLSVNFDASASTAVSPATIQSWNITYGDGGSGTGVTQSHTYQNAGHFGASLVVRDSNGCDSAQTTQAIDVGNTSTTLTMMEGQNNYAGTTDVWLDANSPGAPHTGDLQTRREATDALVMKFAIFVREGGQVPDNAIIHSATLSLYKWGGPDTVMKASRLRRSFTESEATWSVAAIGAPWTTAGAQGAGSDYETTPDGQASIGDGAGCTTAPFPDTCWLNIDVTTGVQAFAGGTSNLGWKLAEVTSSQPTVYKFFNSKENNFFPTLRPKLTVRYTVPTVATLMQGQNNYVGATDVWLDANSPTTPHTGDMQTRREATDALVMKFAIFVREGGQVPDNAIIHSATLSLYKFGGPDMVMKASRLRRSFNESQATWSVAATGAPWTTAGAQGAGSDYETTPDGQASIGDGAACQTQPFPDTCWLNIDVTSGVQAFAGGTSNLGWKLAEASSSQPTVYKFFNSKENTFFPTLRPKLTVSYTVPTSVTLMQGQNDYDKASDVWIDANSPSVPHTGDLQTRREATDALATRFAIFAREGGPVPDNAIIYSATLSLYKWGGPDMVMKASRLLRSFDESQATWSVAATGAPWTTAGALGAGNDYLTAADGQSSIGDDTGCTTAPFPDRCWLNIDVTSGVQAFAGGTSNFGWKLAEASSSQPTVYKFFNSKENNFFPTLRPKLTIQYTQ